MADKLNIVRFLPTCSATIAAVDSRLGKSSIDPQHVSEHVQQLTVQAITIDEFIMQSGWERLDVINLDIDGNDCSSRTREVA